jgi:Raf kinase inhibitor-like YbhB/YbcL family protein
MILTSPIFENGGAIPVKYTCDGGGINPELQIQNVPSGAKSLALIMHDPDAPRPGGFTHWVVWNIDPETTIIKTESVPPKSIEGMNSAGNTNYVAPCPHQGTHRYIFYLYALDSAIDLPVGASLESVKKEIEKHLLAETELMGTYQRKNEN